MKITRLLTKNFCTLLNNDLKHAERRVVVTGIGMVSPLGINVKESWVNIKNYESGIKDLSNMPYAKDLPKNCKIGAAIPHNFDPKPYKTIVHILIIKYKIPIGNGQPPNTNYLMRYRRGNKRC
jgi:3-oxoacyl-(acyl-carrier-protein) synthase